MRRNIVWEGADQLHYEIREIVGTAHKLEELGVEVIYENIGDPVQKGEEIAPWIRDIITGLASDSKSYAYTATEGDLNTRKFLADLVNKRGGCEITANDLIFFNGLGDAVSTVFAFLKREARVIGPSPAYSTLSSAEAAHSGYNHMTYTLDPEKNWMPDLDDLEKKVRYNDSIAGILLINPDNPTGAVYPTEVLKQIVDIARRYDLFVISDETYAHIVYNGGKTCHLSEVIGEVPGIAMRSISKEYPWPGGRCGWLEVFNRHRDANFDSFIQTLINAKRLEVCSTTLPQLSIPLVMGDPRYIPHLEGRAAIFAERAVEAVDILNKVPGIRVNLPRGAFYLTVLIDPESLTNWKTLEMPPLVEEFLREPMSRAAPDKKLVYNLLGATGLCTVPLSGFCTDLPGFRVTLLENDDEKRLKIWHTLAESLTSMLSS
ncbi:pyridoxal phosphate-dependent aminotransferase [Oceanispirochaeta sp.]|jgi:alanine-synthesizing transaminase|uniref:pyridoxal phosphate-dependent aminotransferase n=1 Tax=Oceanispirochaeta sp. TaxID=2035350 RepID=UPI00262D133D|nr:pyridoxal phosphate-dependent aminotransferase [Oceanispirochaeta sp.]MDA3958491.1 pyridoxal phosphate-dependent aminotransferase [Oceanispirochaeta sp.]